MKGLTIFLLGLALGFASVYQTYGQGLSQIQINQNYQGQDLATVLRSLEDQHGIRFFFNSDWLEGKQVSIALVNASLEQFLKSVLLSEGLSYVVYDDYTVLILNERPPAEYFVPPTQQEDAPAIQIGDPSLADPAKQVRVTGRVKDASNEEYIVGARVYIDKLKTGTVTDVNGNYSLDLLPGKYEVTFSFVGLQDEQRVLQVYSTGNFDMELFEAPVELEGLVIQGEADDANISGAQMGRTKLTVLTLKKMPALLGEVDVVRSITMLPGVNTVGEGATGFNVRGGGIDQNLILLDEAPIFNSSHLFGFFSVFNPDAVKDVNLIKGGIPAQYGGRLSSLLDVRMKEGNSKQFEVSGGVGAIFSRLTVEGPIKKDKASFIVSGRRSYIDVLAQPFLNDDLSGSAFNFYDLTLKTNYNINEKNRIFLSGYFGRDNFDVPNVFKFNWGNATTSFRWNHLFNDRLFSNLTVFYSNYDYQLGFGEDDNTFDWDSKIVNYSIKPEFSYYVNPDNLLTFGGQTILYDFEPGNAVSQNTGEVTDISLDHKYALESSLYLGNEQTVNEKLTLQYGLRFSHFNYMGEGTAYEFAEAEEPATRREPISEREFDQWESIQTYSNFEPRLSFKYQLNSFSSIKGSYNRTAQYIHLVSNTTAATPLDVWTPSTNNVKPAIADQWVLGYFRNFKENTWETSAEVYYKDYTDLVEYIDGADLLLNEFLEGDLISAQGRAYGLELYVKKKQGQFTGWAAYTLARSEVQANGINNDQWYPNRFDQTHKLNVVGFYEYNKKWTFSANFTLVSGTPATFPTDRFEHQGYAIPYNARNDRNNVRIPVYHRLDISATMQGKRREGKRNQDYWVFSIYNLYSKRNPFSIYFNPEADRRTVGQPINTEATRLSIIGNFIPSVSYNFKF